jgi:uncharacterized protein YndB with AHSA1/START domain
MPSRRNAALSILAAVLIFACPAASHAAGKKSAGAPDLPEGAVLRMRYETTQGGVGRNGLAFAANVEGHEGPVLLTALHLFGPPAGLRKWVTAREFMFLVTGASGADAFSGKSLTMRAEALDTPEGGLGGDDPTGDFAAFALSEGPKIKPIPLAGESPAEGEKLWLAAPAMRSAARKARLHAATVVKSEGGLLTLAFDDATLLCIGAAGAPILDSEGRAAGMVVEAGGTHEGRPVMRAVAAERFRAAVKDALAAWEKDQAGRAIEREAVAEASLSDAWKVWTTSEGIVSFLAPKAEIEMRPGGAYRILFDPEAPEGSRGCDSCTVLAFTPERRLVTTWIAPPKCSAVRGVPMRLAFWFEPMESDDVLKPKTRVRMRLSGFGEGPDWDCTYAYFDRAWTNVMEFFKKRFAEGPVEWGSSAAFHGVNTP